MKKAKMHFAPFCIFCFDIVSSSACTFPRALDEDNSEPRHHSDHTSNCRCPDVAWLAVLVFHVATCDTRFLARSFYTTTAHVACCWMSSCEMHLVYMLRAQSDWERVIITGCTLNRCLNRPPCIVTESLNGGNAGKSLMRAIACGFAACTATKFKRKLSSLWFKVELETELAWYSASASCAACAAFASYALCWQIRNPEWTDSALCSGSGAVICQWINNSVITCHVHCEQAHGCSGNVASPACPLDYIIYMNLHPTTGPSHSQHRVTHSGLGLSQRQWVTF